MTTRKALAGTCPRCQKRVVRGADQHGRVAVVELGDHTAADELRAWMDGRPTYRADWRGHLELDHRDVSDLVVDPAGYRPGRIYAAHRCEGEHDG